MIVRKALKPWIRVGEGPIKAIKSFGDKLFVVSGDGVFCVGKSGKIERL